MTWNDPIELPPLLPEVPALEPAWVPECLREWILDEAERMQVPPEMIAIPAVVGLSGIVARKVGIYPKQKDSWLVVANLWGAVVAPSATLKSPSQKSALEPLRRLAEAAKADFQSAYAAFKSEEEAFKIKHDEAKATLKSACKAGDGVPEAEAALNSLTAPNHPVRRRYFTNDPTVEKLAELLVENPRGLLLVRDELAGFLKSLDKQGRDGDREFYLEAWAGDNTYAVDRIKRGTIEVPANCVAIIGGIQPGKLQEHVLGMLEGGEGDDGLLQRFQLAVYPDQLPGWQMVDRAPDQAAFERVCAVLSRLDELEVEKLGAEMGRTVPGIRFDDDAQLVFNSWLWGLETKLRSGELGSPAFESHLGKYRSLVPSLALIFDLVQFLDSAPTPGRHRVSLDATIKAISFADYLEAHAKRIFAATIQPDLAAAHALAAKLKKKEVQDGVTVRELYRRQWSHLANSELVKAGLKILEGHNWVRLVDKSTGGRPTTKVHLHPNFVGK